MSCPFAAPGRQEACLSLQRQRLALMKREYDPNECFSCPMRRKRLEGAVEPERIAIPPAKFNNTEPSPPKKETPVATDKKDTIFKRIENEKRCTKSRLMNFCGATADQVAEATKALEAEGKIKVHPGIREGAVIYTLPGVPKDYEGSVPTKKATGKKMASTPREPVVRNRKAAVPSNGVYAAAIADLEARRTAALDQVEKFDRALETLRALA